MSPSTTTSTTTSTTAREDDEQDLGLKSRGVGGGSGGSSGRHRRRRCLNTSGEDEDDEDDEQDEYDYEENGSAFDSDLNADLNSQYSGFNNLGIVMGGSGILRSGISSIHHHHSQTHSQKQQNLDGNTSSNNHSSNDNNGFLNSLTRSASEEALPVSTVTIFFIFLSFRYEFPFRMYLLSREYY